MGNHSYYIQCKAKKYIFKRIKVLESLKAGNFMDSFRKILTKSSMTLNKIEYEAEKIGIKI